MSEWWTYTLTDFLLFSPRTYYRLFELYNADIWPVQILALALGAAILVLMHRGGAWRGPLLLTMLAGCWLFIAWAFHINRYASINWTAAYFAAGFAIEALLLLWTALRRRIHLRPAERLAGRAGLGLFLFALLIQPLIGPLLGRPWAQIELFGTSPDPTALATLGIVLGAADRVYWELLVIPAIWCAITGATLWTMGSPDALVTPLAALFALVLALSPRTA